MFTFVSGRVALDFAGTLAYRPIDPFDRLGEPADLADWIVRADLLSERPNCDARALAAAIRLREAIFRLAYASATGTSPDGSDADRDIVNTAAAGQQAHVALAADATVRRSGDVTAAMAVIARDAVELLGGPDRHRIKVCEAEDCNRLYVDTSRGGSRRWCDMARCGNRAKGAAFRARRQD